MAELAIAPAQLEGIYEHSPWVAHGAMVHAPFRSLAHLKHVLAQVVRDAGSERQLELLRPTPSSRRVSR